ncbi:hypothetical protein [Halalkalibaculum sp. DA3122]|uniref:hypothetical protein n=1 Tax=Halalkalibaculum sp. DA3122 TaxID=3373607 RepID=UPI0037549E7E
MGKKVGFIFAGTVIIWVAFYILYPSQPLDAVETFIVVGGLSILTWIYSLFKKRDKHEQPEVEK